jgi:hypothetical protein
LNGRLSLISQRYIAIITSRKALVRLLDIYVIRHQGEWLSPMPDYDVQARRVKSMGLGTSGISRRLEEWNNAVMFNARPGDMVLKQRRLLGLILNIPATGLLSLATC